MLARNARRVRTVYNSAFSRSLRFRPACEELEGRSLPSGSWIYDDLVASLQPQLNSLPNPSPPTVDPLSAAPWSIPSAPTAAPPPRSGLGGSFDQLPNGDTPTPSNPPTTVPSSPGSSAGTDGDGGDSIFSYSYGGSGGYSVQNTSTAPDGSTTTIAQSGTWSWSVSGWVSTSGNYSTTGGQNYGYSIEITYNGADGSYRHRVEQGSFSYGWHTQGGPNGGSWTTNSNYQQGYTELDTGGGSVTHSDTATVWNYRFSWDGTASGNRTASGSWSSGPNGTTSGSSNYQSNDQRTDHYAHTSTATVTVTVRGSTSGQAVFTNGYDSADSGQSSWVGTGSGNSSYGPNGSSGHGETTNQADASDSSQRVNRATEDGSFTNTDGSGLSTTRNARDELNSQGTSSASSQSTSDYSGPTSTWSNQWQYTNHGSTQLNATESGNTSEISPVSNGLRGTVSHNYQLSGNTASTEQDSGSGSASGGTNIPTTGSNQYSSSLTNTQGYGGSGSSSGSVTGTTPEGMVVSANFGGAHSDSGSGGYTSDSWGTASTGPAGTTSTDSFAINVSMNTGGNWDFSGRRDLTLSTGGINVRDSSGLTLDQERESQQQASGSGTSTRNADGTTTGSAQNSATFRSLVTAHRTEDERLTASGTATSNGFAISASAGYNSDATARRETNYTLSASLTQFADGTSTRSGSVALRRDTSSSFTYGEDNDYSAITPPDDGITLTITDDDQFNASGGDNSTVTLNGSATLNRDGTTTGSGRAAQVLSLDRSYGFNDDSGVTATGQTTEGQTVTVTRGHHQVDSGNLQGGYSVAAQVNRLANGTMTTSVTASTSDSGELSARTTFDGAAEARRTLADGTTVIERDAFGLIVDGGLQYSFSGDLNGWQFNANQTSGVAWSMAGSLSNQQNGPEVAQEGFTFTGAAVAGEAVHLAKAGGTITGSQILSEASHGQYDGFTLDGNGTRINSSWSTDTSSANTIPVSMPGGSDTPQGGNGGANGIDYYPIGLALAIGQVPDQPQQQQQETSVMARVVGGLQFIGGFLEMAGGVALVAGSGILEVGTVGASTPISVPGVVGGGAITFHGFDTMSTGWRQILDGRWHKTMTAQAVTSVTGSETAGDLADAAAGFTSGGTAAQALTRQFLVRTPEGLVVVYRGMSAAQAAEMQAAGVSVARGGANAQPSTLGWVLHPLLYGESRKALGLVRVSPYDSGYLSVSSLPRVARQFAKNPGEVVGKVAVHPRDLIPSLQSYQGEFLLQKGTRLRYLGEAAPGESAPLAVELIEGLGKARQYTELFGRIPYSLYRRGGGEQIIGDPFGWMDDRLNPFFLRRPKRPPVAILIEGPDGAVIIGEIIAPPDGFGGMRFP